MFLFAARKILPVNKSHRQVSGQRDAQSPGLRLVFGYFPAWASPACGISYQIHSLQRWFRRIFQRKVSKQIMYTYFGALPKYCNSGSWKLLKVPSWLFSHCEPGRWQPPIHIVDDCKKSGCVKPYTSWDKPATSIGSKDLWTIKSMCPRNTGNAVCSGKQIDQCGSTGNCLAKIDKIGAP